MLLLFLIREAEYHLLGCISLTFVNCCVWFLGCDVGFIYINSWLPGYPPSMANWVPYGQNLGTMPK